MIGRLLKGQAGFVGQFRGHPSAEFRVRVDTGPNGRPTDGEPPQGLLGTAQAHNTIGDHGRVAREFLPQANGGGILEMSAADFQDAIKADRFFLQGLVELLKGR